MCFRFQKNCGDLAENHTHLSAGVDILLPQSQLEADVVEVPIAILLPQVSEQSSPSILFMLFIYTVIYTFYNIYINCIFVDHYLNILVGVNSAFVDRCKLRFC